MTAAKKPKAKKAAAARWTPYTHGPIGYMTEVDSDSSAGGYAKIGCYVEETMAGWTALVIYSLGLTAEAKSFSTPAAAKAAALDLAKLVRKWGRP